MWSRTACKSLGSSFSFNACNAMKVTDEDCGLYYLSITKNIIICKFLRQISDTMILTLLSRISCFSFSPYNVMKVTGEDNSFYGLFITKILLPFANVMFLHLSVSQGVHGGGQGVCIQGGLQGVCIQGASASRRG